MKHSIELSYYEICQAIRNYLATQGFPDTDKIVFTRMEIEKNPVASHVINSLQADYEYVRNE